MKPDSIFLNALNSITYPLDAIPPEEGVKYFTICGRAPGAFVSPAAWRQDGSDWVVGCNSQKGITLDNMRVFVPQGEVEITAHHCNECTQIATTGELIKFLDYTTPVLEIDAVNGETPSEDPNAPTEITGTSITIEGTLAKEYLPADTKIKYQVYDEYENPIFDEEQEIDKETVFFPLSPVEEGKIAWFEEEISLPDEVLDGEVYRMEMKAINPGGKESEITVFYFKGVYYELSTDIDSLKPDQTWYGLTQNVLARRTRGGIVNPDEIVIARTLFKYCPKNKFLNIYLKWNPEGRTENVSAYEVEPSDFELKTVTWNTKPALGNLIGSKTVSGVGWYKFGTGTTGTLCLRLVDESSEETVHYHFYSYFYSDKDYRPYFTDDSSFTSFPIEPTSTEEWTPELEEGTEKDTGK